MTFAEAVSVGTLVDGAGIATSTGFGAPWTTVATVVVVTAAIYASVVIAVRIAGRRTLAELSAFDVVVTIALGTILGSTALSRSISYAEGLAAVVTLLVLQISLAAVRRSSARARQLLDFRPVELIRDGELELDDGVLGPQLTEDEVNSKLRLAGAFDRRDVDRAVLEPTSGVSIARRDRSRRDRTRRSTREVLEAHLRRRADGDLERDLLENYSKDVVVLSAGGASRGHDGVRELARAARRDVGGIHVDEQLLVAGRIGMVRWSEDGTDAEANDGVDSYVVEDGLIVAQTIHDWLRTS